MQERLHECELRVSWSMRSPWPLSAASAARGATAELSALLWVVGDLEQDQPSEASARPRGSDVHRPDPVSASGRLAGERLLADQIALELDRRLVPMLPVRLAKPAAVGRSGGRDAYHPSSLLVILRWSEVEVAPEEGDCVQSPLPTLAPAAPAQGGL